MIVFVEAGRRYMVAIVPVEVGHTGIISVVLDDLLLVVEVVFAEIYLTIYEGCLWPLDATLTHSLVYKSVL